MQETRTTTDHWLPGWYLLTGSGLGLSKLTVTFEGPEVSRHTSVHVVPAAAGGRLESPLVLAYAASRVTITSGEALSFPGSTTLQLRRISRFQGLLRMLLGIRTSTGRSAWGVIARTLRSALSVASYSGPHRAVAFVVACYQQQVQSPENLGAGAIALRLGWRWLGWIRADLKPVQHLAPSAFQGGWWEATGEDPRFLLATGDAPVFLKAGWYRFRARMNVGAGSVVAPILYPDYGEGCRHDERIRLPDPDSNGVIDVIVMLKRDAQTLRFDPTVRRACFAVERLELIRLGRASALLGMLRALPNAEGQPAWRARLDAVTSFGRGVFRRGVSVAASDLFARQPYRLQAEGGSYSDWVRRYDTIGKLDLGALRLRARTIADGPLISLILPVYQTPESWLRRCLDSVLEQAYERWELCVADDASPDPRVRTVLEEYAARDQRIKLAFRSSNGHIVEASNTALALATGDFIGLLDHDDELRPHALLEVAETVRAGVNVGLVYSDEDKIDAEGRRFNPYFKPDWNPDLLLSQNYVCHFTAIRTELARAVGGFRKGFEGSQDHDLVLRCTEHLSPAQIRHIPKVLYHWRAIEGSTALGRDAKDYASAAGVRAVADHLLRIGVNASAEELPHGHYRVHWPMPETPPKVSIVIPTRDRVELLRGCVESIRLRTDYPSYEIVVIDNQSTEPATLEYLDELRLSDDVRILTYDAPFNYSAINNWAVEKCDGDVLCLLNNDIEAINAGWLSEMVAHALRPDIGAVGAMLYYPDRTIQHAGVILGVGGVANHAFAHEPAGFPGHGARALVAQNLSAVTGACLVMRREIFLQVGGLDVQLQIAFNDIDFCLRIRRAGYRILWTPFAELFHHESASRGADDTSVKRQRFVSEVELMQQRWGEELLHDPAYNPNLSLTDSAFHLAFPPRSASLL
jgi:O-antigen biosynthesis protein